jgi:hypothetical protein
MTCTDHVCVRATQLEDLLTGADRKPMKLVSVKNGDSVTEQPNPEYTKWATRDQALLGYLLSSLSQEILTGLTTQTTSATVWVHLPTCLAPAPCLIC